MEKDFEKWRGAFLERLGQVDCDPALRGRMIARLSEDRFPDREDMMLLILSLLDAMPGSEQAVSSSSPGVQSSNPSMSMSRPRMKRAPAVVEVQSNGPAPGECWIQEEVA